MVLSLARLVAAAEAVRLKAQGSGPSLATRVREIVSVAPNVTLLAAVPVGTPVIGPRNIAEVVVRNGLLAWIAKTVRQMAGN